MSKCTVKGFKEYPSLPMEGLQALKETIKSLSPDFEHNPIKLRQFVRSTLTPSITHAVNEGNDYMYIALVCIYVYVYTGFLGGCRGPFRP